MLVINDGPYVTNDPIADGLLQDSIERQAEARDWKAELKRIVEFLNAADDEATTSLWDVLSALRGPDAADPMEVLKLSTTAVIRNAIGLRMKNTLVIHPDMARSVAVRAKLTLMEHFPWHASRAFACLGLRWDTLNGEAGAPQ